MQFILSNLPRIACGSSYVIGEHIEANGRVRSVFVARFHNHYTLKEQTNSSLKSLRNLWEDTVKNPNSAERTGKNICYLGSAMKTLPTLGLVLASSSVYGLLGTSVITITLLTSLVCKIIAFRQESEFCNSSLHKISKFTCLVTVAATIGYEGELIQLALITIIAAVTFQHLQAYINDVKSFLDTIQAKV